MKSMLVIGSEGYIGHHIANYFESLGWPVYCTGLSESKRANYFCLDITDKEAVARIVQELHPQVVVQAAGLSSLALCEQNPARARAVNIDGNRNLIEAVKPLNDSCKLVFLSSDYVFEGEASFYDEESVRRPQTEYGRTKVASEDDIRSALHNYIILRMSNVYGRGGNFYNFVNSDLALKQPVELFTDTYYTPVSIDFLVRALKGLVEIDHTGVLHIGGPERLSRYEFGLLVAEHLNADVQLVGACRQPPDGLISRDSSLCTDKSTHLLSLYNPPVIKALHVISGTFTYPHLHFTDSRGILRGISQGRSWEEMNYAESISGAVRGGHYHRRTVEGFYIIRGKLKVHFKSLKTALNYWFMAERGDSFLIPPLTVHTFEVMEEAAWINYLSRAMSDEDKDIRRE